MTIVADKYDYVIGVDTHSRSHTYAIVDTTTGARISCEAFSVTKPGMNRAIAWIRRNTTGEILAAIEGANSYGSSIRRALIVEGIRAVKVKPPQMKVVTESENRIRSMHLPQQRAFWAKRALCCCIPAMTGNARRISVPLAARRRIDHQRTANRNALNALVRLIDLGVDARHALSDKPAKENSEWRTREHDTVEQRIARAEAIDLAKSVQACKARLKEIEAELVELDEKMAPGMQDQFAMGPVTVGIISAAYSHQGRVRSEAAFPVLAGVSPLQASSGNTKRRRLNRGGDRQLKTALDIIARNRMTFDEKTKAYVQRRTAEGLSYKEIKRFLAR